MASSHSEQDWNIARKGISLLLNNETGEAELLFTGHPHSFRVKAGHCFVLFMVREYFQNFWTLDVIDSCFTERIDDF